MLFESGRKLLGKSAFSARGTGYNSALVSKLDLRAASRALLSLRPQDRAGPETVRAAQWLYRWGQDVCATVLRAQTATHGPGHRGDLLNGQPPDCSRLRFVLRKVHGTNPKRAVPESRTATAFSP